MLKSLFLKQKAETDELLPPPPPFPSMELEEPEQEAASEGQFDDLFKDVERDMDLGHEIKETKAKPKKLSKKELKKLSKIKTKESGLKKKGKIKSEPKEEPYGLDKDFDFETGPEFHDLEEFSIGDLKAEEEIKPKEIEEAEDEIAGAIEGVKNQGKQSFFSGLFGKKAAREQEAMPETEEDGLSAINKMIINARNALMNLDLESARKGYIEIMRLYNRLKPEEQARVYHEIRDLYYERKNAEELKV